jgi:hypothetical protein
VAVEWEKQTDAYGYEASVYSTIHNYAENIKKIWPVHMLDVERQLSA